MYFIIKFLTKLLFVIFKTSTIVLLPVQMIESAERKVRGPYLARLELHKRMRVQSMDAEALLGDFSILINEYFRLFGDKPCCTHDIALFLPSISMEGRQQLASKLLLESGISSTTLPQDVSNTMIKNY